MKYILPLILTLGIVAVWLIVGVKIMVCVMVGTFIGMFFTSLLVANREEEEINKKNEEIKILKEYLHEAHEALADHGVFMEKPYI